MGQRVGWIVVFCLGISAPAQAVNEVSLRASNTFVGTAELATVADDGLLLQAEFSYARRLLAGRWGSLWAETGWTVGHAGSSVFAGALKTDAWLHALTVGGRYALPLTSWLALQLRAGVGLGLGTFRLEERVAARGLDVPSDTALALAGHALGGVSLLWPRPWRRGSNLRGGLVLEGGIAFNSGYDFDLSPQPSDEDALHTPLSGSSMGTVNTTGPAVRAGVALQF